MFEIRRYTTDKASEWNAFVAKSKNGTFLFDRRYMDYHSDRFDDHSLLVYRKNRLFALLPGNKKGNTFFSHQGLTYGGFITDHQATAEYVCDAFDAVNAFLRSEGFLKVVYKPMPWIYQTTPAEEDVYALFVRCHARLIERDVSSTIFLPHRIKFAESRMSGIRKARREGLTVCESDDSGTFWRILVDNLHRKYGAHPVHTVSEMQMLKERFPNGFVCLPSSVHDWILLPKDLATDTASLLEMVKTINANEVLPQDQLADDVFTLDDEGHLISIA